MEASDKILAIKAKIDEAFKDLGDFWSQMSEDVNTDRKIKYELSDARGLTEICSKHLSILIDLLKAKATQNGSE